MKYSFSKLAIGSPVETTSTAKIEAVGQTPLSIPRPLRPPYRSGAFFITVCQSMEFRNLRFAILETLKQIAIFVGRASVKKDVIAEYAA